LNPLLGIDFGTTNAAAALVLGRDVKVVPHAGGALTIPAVVAIPPVAVGGRPVVGAEAQAVGVRHPERCITTIKRLLGRKMETPEVRHQRQEVPYELVMAKNGDARIRVGRRHHAAPDLAAYVFGALRQAAEAMAGTAVTAAVLAIPADFNDLQRQAIRDSARIAGLEVVGVITEPAAAALASGIFPLERARDKKEHRVLVYDLGGGSFDVAALLVRDQGVEVLASGGDAFLGGEDFDQRVVSDVCEQFMKAGGGDLRRERLLLPRLRAAAEWAKRQLSTVESVTIQLPELMARMPTGVTLTRERFESLTQDLVDRTVWPCERVLNDAKWSVEDVETLIMVGGQTNAPRVRAHIAEWLGKAALPSQAPESLVALGAAHHGIALLAGPKRRKGQVAISEATCLSLGIESAGGVLTRLIPKGAPLPARHSQVFSTAADGQAHITIHLLQGEREMATDNDSIAHLQIGPLAPAPKGQPQIEVEIMTDGGGLPRAAARDLATDEPVAVRIRPSGGLTEAELVALTAIHAGVGNPAGGGDDAARPEVVSFGGESGPIDTRSGRSKEQRG